MITFYYTFGVYSTSSFTVSGGALNVNSGTANLEVNGKSYGIQLTNRKNLIVSNGKLNARAGVASGESVGIYGSQSTLKIDHSDVTVVGDNSAFYIGPSGTFSAINCYSIVAGDTSSNSNNP